MSYDKFSIFHLPNKTILMWIAYWYQHMLPMIIYWRDDWKSVFVLWFGVTLLFYKDRQPPYFKTFLSKKKTKKKRVFLVLVKEGSQRLTNPQNLILWLPSFITIKNTVSTRKKSMLHSTQNIVFELSF